MTTYTKSTNFATKDALLTGNPSKVVKGTEIDAEFTAIQAADATSLKSGGSSTGLAFLQAGTGSSSRTVQAKLRDVVSVKDFGAVGDGVTDDLVAFNNAAALTTNGQVIVPPGTYSLSADVTTPCTWLIDAAAHITGGTLTPVGAAYSGCRAVSLSDSESVYNKGTKIGSMSAWVRTAFGPLEDTSDLMVLSRTGTYAFVSATRSSDYTTAPPAANATIGITGFALNDRTSPQVSVYAGYYEAVRDSGAGTTLGIEIDCVNRGSNLSSTPYASIPTGTTAALWLASGGEEAVTASTLGLGFAKNGTTFNTGVCFGSDSITGTDGVTGTGIAVAMAKGHTLAWYSPNGSIVGSILSTAVDGTTAQQIEFSSTGLILSDPTADAFYVGLTAKHKLYDVSGKLTVRIGTGGPFLSISNPSGNVLDFNNASGSSFGFSAIGTRFVSLTSTAIYPETTNAVALGGASLRWSNVFSTKYALTDVTGNAEIYVDGTDGDLKVRFGDGTIKTIATNP